MEVRVTGDIVQGLMDSTLLKSAASAAYAADGTYCHNPNSRVTEKFRGMFASALAGALEGEGGTVPAVAFELPLEEVRRAVQAGALLAALDLDVRSSGLIIE